MRGGRLTVGRSGRLHQLAVEVTTTGSTGAKVRLGVYRINTISGAFELLIDASQVDRESTAVRTATVNVGVLYGDILIPVAVPEGGAITRASDLAFHHWFGRFHRGHNCINCVVDDAHRLPARRRDRGASYCSRSGDSRTRIGAEGDGSRRIGCES